MIVLKDVIIELKLHAMFGYYNTKWGKLEYEPGKRKRLEALAFKLHEMEKENG